MLGTKKKEETLPVNEALLNVITPMGLEIKRNSLVIGENMGKVYGAVRYPQKVEMGWLSKITNIPSTIVSVGITPIDNSTLISALSKSIVQQRGAADSAKDPLTRQRAEKAAEDGEHIMQKIDQEGETVAMMSLTVMPVAQDEAAFSKICRRVESAFSVQKCKVRTLANLQKEGFQSISPTYPANGTVDSIVSRIIPMSTFVGGFPFASSGYSDGRGYYFAKDSSGGLVILDPWTRGNDRTNSSFVVMGVAGIGKSTVVKHIMLSEYMKGTKILCIDPESEYKDMCRNLGGNWLNAGGGRNGRSNLLQIRPAPRDDEDETDKLYTDEGNGMSDMALHTGEHYVIDGIDGYLTNEPDRDYQFIIYDCGVIQTPTSVFREADHRLLCGSVLPYEIPAFHKALEVCGGLEVRPVAISVPGEFRAYCRELFGGEMEMAEASHDLFANRTNGRLYKRLIEPYIMGERRL